MIKIQLHFTDVNLTVKCCDIPKVIDPIIGWNFDQVGCLYLVFNQRLNTGNTSFLTMCLPNGFPSASKDLLSRKEGRTETKIKIPYPSQWLPAS